MFAENFNTYYISNGEIFISKQQVPIWEKINLTIQEAVAYSNIGESTIRGLLKMAGCPFLLKVGSKQLVKRVEFEKYLKDKHYL